MARNFAFPLAFPSHHVFHHGQLSLPCTLALRCSRKHLIGFRCTQIISADPPNAGVHVSKNFECPLQSTLFFSEVISLDAQRTAVRCLGTGAAIYFTLVLTGDSSAVTIESQLEAAKALVAEEPTNVLSLPTWTIHVSSVVEWMTAMALVWQYGDKPGNQAWKGLSWGMVVFATEQTLMGERNSYFQDVLQWTKVPLLGGAMCACTWHFFYNAESLEILVVMQAALTVFGNFTMWVAAFRIYESTKGGSKTS